MQSLFSTALALLLVSCASNRASRQDSPPAESPKPQQPLSPQEEQARAEREAAETMERQKLILQQKARDAEREAASARRFEELAQAADAERKRDPLRCTAEEIEAQCSVKTDRFKGLTWVTSPVVRVRSGCLYMLRQTPNGTIQIYTCEPMESYSVKKELVLVGGRSFIGVHAGATSSGSVVLSNWVFSVERSLIEGIREADLEFAIYGEATTPDFEGRITPAIAQGFLAAAVRSLEDKK